MHLPPPHSYTLRGRWEGRRRTGSGAHAGHDSKSAFRSDQGGTRDIREPTMKRSSKSIHLRVRRAWKEAGGASAAMRSKGGTNGRGPPDWTATILESLARRLSSPCSFVAPRTPMPPRSEITSRGGRYFKYRPPLGLLEPLDQTRASPMSRGLRQRLGRPPQAGSGLGTAGARRGVARARQRGPAGRRGSQ